MKKFKGLFYTGLTLVLMPIIVALVVFYFSYDNRKKSKKIEDKKPIIYDTIRIKVYDTVVIEKIKYIKKVKIESDSL